MTIRHHEWLHLTALACTMALVAGDVRATLVVRAVPAECPAPDWPKSCEPATRLDQSVPDFLGEPGSPGTRARRHRRILACVALGRAGSKVKSKVCPQSSWRPEIAETARHTRQVR